MVQAEDSGREWYGGKQITAWGQLSGDWAGQRTRLADAGVAIEATLVNEVSEVLRAGLDDGTSRRIGQRSQVNVGVILDLDRLAHLSKAEVQARYQYAGGDDASHRMGDAQGWSNINVSSDIHQLSELWYQQGFGVVPGGGDDDLLRIKMGKLDATNEFASLPALAQFLNSSAGFSPTILPFPTYPNPAVGANVFVQPVAGIIAGFGVYDASATTRGVATGELGQASFFAHDLAHDKVWLGQLGGQWRGGSAQVGGWLLRGELSGFDGAESTRTSGWYALGQQELWTSGETQAITAVAQVAGADDNLSNYGRHLAAGLWGQGLIPGREADGVGLYVTDVTFTDATDDVSDRLFPASHETVIEVVYACQAAGWWLVRADAQYIQHPGGSLDPTSAMVVALRSDITF